MHRITCLWWLTIAISPVTSLSEDVMYISTNSNSGIMKLDSTGQSAFCDLKGCDGMVFDAIGNLYTVRINDIHKIDSAGNASLFASGIRDNSHGLAMNGNGDLYVANGYGHGTIQKCDTSGTVSLFSDAPELIEPFDLAFDSKGSLYVSDMNTDSIVLFSPEGNVSVFASGLDSPMGLAFDRNDNLYVACNGTNTIVELDPSGNATLFASTLPVVNPWDIAFGSNGDLYVISRWSDTVLKLDSMGQSSVFATLPQSSSPKFITIVPEPATLSLLGLGGLALMRRRKRG